MTILPTAWTEATLGGVAKWGSGGTPTSSNPAYYNGDIPWAVIGDLTDGPVERTAKSITRRGLDKSSAKIVQPGTLLIAMYGSIGSLGVARIPMATNQAIATAVPDTGMINPDYLFWYLRSQRPRFATAGKGATQDNVGQAILKAWPIPLAPLPEQRRIVAAIEEELSRLDSANAALRRISHQVKRYRRALLQLAVPSDSRPVPLGDLLERVEAGKSFRAIERPAEPTEWGVIKVSAMTWGAFREHENKAVPAGRRVDSRHEIQSCDLLLSRANTREHVGASVLVPVCRPRLLLSDKSLRLVPKTGVDTRWLHLALSAPTVRGQISAVATGTKDGMRNISQEKLKRIRLCSLSVERQRELANEIDQALSSLDRVRDVLATTERRATILRSAVLADAFSGRLTQAGVA